MKRVNPYWPGICQIAVFTLAGLFLSACERSPLSPITERPDAMLFEATNGPLGGEIVDLVIHPGGVVVAAGLTGEVFRSTDDGKTWVKLSSIYSVGSLAGNSEGDLVAGGWNGFFFSTDAGEEWHRVDRGYTSVTDIAVDSQGDFVASTSVGVFKSTDGGASWDSKGLNTSPLMLVAAGDPGFMVAFVGWQDVFRTTDDGASWLKTGLSANLGSLLITESGRVLAGGLDGVYTSDDKGTTWTWRSSDFGGMVKDFARGSAGSLLTAAGNGIYESNDDGVSWDPKGLAGVGTRAIAVGAGGDLIAGAPDGVYLKKAGSDIWDHSGVYLTNIVTITSDAQGRVYTSPGSGLGFFRSTDEGETWQWTGSKLASPRVLAVTPLNLILAGDYNGIHRSTDLGETWERVYQNYSGIEAFAFNAQGHIFAGGYGILRSTDNGVSWTALGMQGNAVYSLVCGSGNEMFAGTYGSVFRSSDGGVSWTPTAVLDTVDYANISSLVYSDGVLIAGTYYAGAYASTDKGVTWRHLGPENYSILSLLKTPNGTLLVSTAYGLFQISLSELFEKHWWRTGLVVPCRKMTVTPSGRVFAATSWGVMRSRKSGL